MRVTEGRRPSRAVWIGLVLAMLGTAAAVQISRAPSAAAAAPGVTRLTDTQLDPAALYFVSYDGLVNNNSFQQNGHPDLRRLPVRRLVHRRPQRRRRPPASSAAAPGRRVQVGHTLERRRLAQRHLHGRLHGRRPPPPRHGLAQRRLHYVKSVAGLMVTTRPAAAGPRPASAPAAHPRRTGAHLAVHLPAVRLAPDGKLQLSYRVGVSGNGATPSPSTTAAPGPTSASGRSPPARTPAARRLAPPQHVPARHRLRPERPPARAFTWREGKTARDVQQRRHHQPRHRLRLLRRPGPHLAQQRGHAGRHAPAAPSRSPHRRASSSTR